MNRGGLDPMWQAGVGVGVPLARGRRRAALAQAESELRGAEARAQAVEPPAAVCAPQERLAQLEAGAADHRPVRAGHRAPGRITVEAAIASYQAGRVPFVTVLEALTTLYADRGTLVRLLAGAGADPGQPRRGQPGATQTAEMAPPAGRRGPRHQHGRVHGSQEPA